MTSEDGLAPADDAFAAALRDHGDKSVTTAHFDTDHAYSDKRLELTAAVLHWLAALPFAPPAVVTPSITSVPLTSPTPMLEADPVR